MDFEKDVKEYMDRLLEGPAFDEPCDKKEIKEDEFQLPPWFNEDLFKKGQRHYDNNTFSMDTNMISGLILVLSVPSILRVLVNSRRTSSPLTAYRRYLSTLLHVYTWLEEPLHPGSVSWESLRTIRSRHFRASRSAESSEVGLVSQRDLAITQFGFIGFALLTPHKLGMQEFEEGAWEGFVHVWRIIGYMIGIHDDYNLCRPNYELTVALCREMLHRVYIPCMTHVPEHFLHMTHVLLDGMWVLNTTSTYRSFMYFTNNLCGVAGYEYTDKELAERRSSLLHQIMEEKEMNKGAENRSSKIKRPGHHLGEPHSTPKLDLKPEYYNSIETLPTFKSLSTWDRIILHFTFYAHSTIYTTYLGRIYFNLQTKFTRFLMKYFPYVAIYVFGIKNAYVNMFSESKKDDTIPMKNFEMLGISLGKGNVQ